MSTAPITIGQYLDSLKEDIAHLNLSNKGLSRIPSLARFTELQSVNLTGNKLKNLPELPDGIQTVYCGNNQLESIDGLPDSIREINAGINKITHIHQLPNQLRSLNIHLNCLQKIDALPPLLEYLYCNSNELEQLPELPESLTSLYCADNRKLTRLPKLPSRLLVMCGNRCGLTRLPKLPLSLCVLNVNENPIGYMENFPIILGTSSGVTLGNNPYMDMLTRNKPEGLTVRQTHEFYRTKINKLQRARELMYTLRLKDKLRAWLWVRVRLPKIERANHPDMLLQYIFEHENEDIEEIMDNFGNAYFMKSM